MKTSTSASRYVLSITSILCLVLFWFVFSLIQNDNWFFPNWNQILVSFESIFTNTKKLGCFGFSLARILITICLAFLSSLIISFLFVVYNPLLELFRPLLIIMKTAPLAIVSIYLFIVVGGKIAPYIITYLFTTPVIVEGMIAALKNIPVGIVNELRITNVPVMKKFFKVYLPIIFPYIVMSLLQTIGLGIKVMMMAEYLCQTTNSVGNLIFLAKIDYKCDDLLAILLLVVIIVASIELIVSRLSKKIFAK